VIVQPQEDRAYTIFAQSMSRDGYARGTLATRTGMQADVPALDPLPTLSMLDMMGAMEHGDAHAMHGMDHGSMPGMDMSGMAGMDHGDMAMSRDAEGPSRAQRVQQPERGYARGLAAHQSGRSRHWPARQWPPRAHLRRSAHARRLVVSANPVTREIELHLTGNMNRFVWGFDGLKFSQAKPVHFRYGEHVRLILVNDTMMTHPIHLHGMWSELESPDQQFQVRKHTISVQPAQRVTYRVMADALGRWAYHCHLLYHMEAGMFREVVVS
jgi:FtsP/CotA-like multicopper oxidase with cupredoxin domain